eukprot:5793447-Ditylum_brightwellii.AAC.1
MALTPKETLVTMFNDNKGLGWKNNDNWLKDQDICTWEGITCYDETESDQQRVGKISKIDLSDNRLNGKFPNQIYELPFINTIIVRDNPELEMDFTGIGEAKYLEVLIL